MGRGRGTVDESRVGADGGAYRRGRRPAPSLVQISPELARFSLDEVNPALAGLASHVGKMAANTWVVRTDPRQRRAERPWVVYRPGDFDGTVFAEFTEAMEYARRQIALSQEGGRVCSTTPSGEERVETVHGAFTSGEGGGWTDPAVPFSFVLDCEDGCVEIVRLGLSVGWIPAHLEAPLRELLTAHPGCVASIAWPDPYNPQFELELTPPRIS